MLRYNTHIGHLIQLLTCIILSKTNVILLKEFPNVALRSDSFIRAAHHPTNTLPHAKLDLNRILLRMRSLCYKINHLQLKSYATQSGETARQSLKTAM